MNFAHFIRIEWEENGTTKHTVVHAHDPKLAVELTPDKDAVDQNGKGVIKRICVPNSWAGNYSQYARILSAAQEFFQKSLAEPAAKNETRRFAR
jgi:hypothetical protein